MLSTQTCPDVPLTASGVLFPNSRHQGPGKIPRRCCPQTRDHSCTGGAWDPCILHSVWPILFLVLRSHLPPHSFYLCRKNRSPFLQALDADSIVNSPQLTLTVRSRSYVAHRLAATGGSVCDDQLDASLFADTDGRLGWERWRMVNFRDQCGHTTTILSSTAINKWDGYMGAAGGSVCSQSSRVRCCSRCRTIQCGPWSKFVVGSTERSQRNCRRRWVYMHTQSIANVRELYECQRRLYQRTLYRPTMLRRSKRSLSVRMSGNRRYLHRTIHRMPLHRARLERRVRNHIGGCHQS